MAFLMDPEFWARWLSIVILDLTLAGDNALVIAWPPAQRSSAEHDFGWRR